MWLPSADLHELPDLAKTRIREYRLRTLSPQSTLSIVTSEVHSSPVSLRDGLYEAQNVMMQPRGVKATMHWSVMKATLVAGLSQSWVSEMLNIRLQLS